MQVMSDCDSTYKTPYQGKQRAFGEFTCEECGREWSSGCTWANKGQMCKKCYLWVYPHTQRKLLRLRRRRHRPSHLDHLCEKCYALPPGERCCTLKVFRRCRKAKRGQRYCPYTDQ